MDDDAIEVLEQAAGETELGAPFCHICEVVNGHAKNCPVPYLIDALVRLDKFDKRASRHHMEMAHQMALNAAMQGQVEAFREALIAERAYHSNNTGENAARRKAAMSALGKGWEKRA